MPVAHPSLPRRVVCIYLQFTPTYNSLPLSSGIPLALGGSYSSRHLVGSIRLLLPPPHFRRKPSLVDAKPGLEAAALLFLLGLSRGVCADGGGGVGR